MKNRSLNILLTLIIAFVFSACVTKRVGEENEIPPNVGTFYYSKKLVWRNLVQIIKNELLMPFQYASYKKGHFVCREITNADQPDMKAKIQLSGFLTFDGAGTVVTLYKQIVVWDDARQEWRAIPTDYVMESSILKRLNQRLAVYKKK